MQDIDRPVGFTRHRLHHVNAKGEQDGAEEDGHHNCRGDDVVVEDIQPARQFEVFNTLLFFAQVRRNFVSNPGGELLLVTDGEAAAVRNVLRWLIHHVGGDAPVKRDQHCRADDRGPHWVAEDIERNGNQPRLLEHDVPGEHDGANTGDAAQEHVNDVQRQREQYRIPNPAVRIPHTIDGGHHGRVSVRDGAVKAVHL